MATTTTPYELLPEGSTSKIPAVASQSSFASSDGDKAQRLRVPAPLLAVLPLGLLLGAAVLVVTLQRLIVHPTPAAALPAVEASFSSPPMTGGKISLNFVRKGPPPAFQGMAIGLSIPGVTDGPQQCLVDLGSSTAAFCDPALPARLAAAEGKGLDPAQRKTDQAQCNAYGVYAGSSPEEPRPGADCPGDVNTSLVYEWFYGSVYHGTLRADNAPSLPPWMLRDVEYTVMDAQSQMT